MYTIERLEKLDKKGYKELLAISLELAPNKATLASPHKFLCEDGKMYWVKGKSQNGLVTELICGRLARLLNSGPNAEVVIVTPGAFNLEDTHKNLEGTVVGIENLSNTENSKEIAPYFSDKEGSLKIDNASRAKVIAFQTWIGVSDQQTLIDLGNGSVSSIDHGGTFSSLDPDGDMEIVIAQIHNTVVTSKTIGLKLRKAASRISKISDKEIMDCLANTPNEDPWMGGIEKRYDMYKFLCSRRDKLLEVVIKWLKKN